MRSLAVSSALVLLAAPAGFACGAVIGLAGYRLLSGRNLLARRVVAATAGTAAFFAPAAATGLDAWDALLRVGLTVVFVLLAGRSRPGWWVPAAAIVAIGMLGAGPPLAAALAVLGATIAFAAGARRLPLAGAVVGALLVQLTLRLEWPERTGATALLTVLALLPIAASGFRRSPRMERRALKMAGIAMGAVAAVGVVTVLSAGLLARDDVIEGADALESGIEAVRRGDQNATRTSLLRANRSFAAARDTLDATWLLPGRLVPVVAQHVAAAQRVARVGGELALTGAQTVAASGLEDLQVENGRIDLTLVRDLRRPVDSALTGLAKAQRELDRAAASRWLVPPLADRLDEEIARLDRSQRQASVLLAVVEQLPALLGGDGQRRYFLAIQSPAELRGSGGIIGSYGEVTTDDGAVAVGNFGRDGDLNTRGTPPEQRTIPGPEDYLARYARFEPQRVWQNVSVSPHFPAVGEVISDLYPQSGGAAVDGVITVDPIALASLLQLVGPITVAPWPEPVTAANAEQILLHDQYVRLEGSARTDFLGDVAEAVGRRLTTGSLPPPAAIVQALAPAVGGHHLSLWSRVPAEQALFRRIGADGGLPPVRGDSLAVVNTNAGGNKLDWFLSRTSDYTARVDQATGRVSGRLTITLENDSPSAGLPAYVIGSSLPSPVDPSGSNRTYLSVYSALRLAGARLDDVPVTMESAREVGRNVFSLYLVVPPGGSRTLTLDLAGEVPRGVDYRLDWRAQPLVRPETVSAKVVSAQDRVLVARPAGPLAEDENLP